jgi:hypothetical protein
MTETEAAQVLGVSAVMVKRPLNRGLRNLTDVCCLMQPFRPSHSNLDRGGGQV